MNRLRRILEYRRGHNSEGEALFVKEMLADYKMTVFVDSKDMALAYVCEVAKENEAGVAIVPPVLWSCHIDTVHSDLAGCVTWHWDTKTQTSIKGAPAAPKGPKQEIVHDATTNIMSMAQDATECLGADDGAGVWLLMEMIDAGVPGTYIFHRGEERGGIGSSGMAEEHEEWLKQFKWAIAFDRCDTTNIITEQGRGICCSNGFARALAQCLNMQSQWLDYSSDDTGVFTDTANYVHLIPECTNVSVGYDYNHGPSEMLDCVHLMELRDCLIAAFKDGTDLPVFRTAEEPASKYSAGVYTGTFTFDKDAFPLDAEEVGELTWSELCGLTLRAENESIADLILTLAEQVIEQKETIEMLEGIVDDAGERAKINNLPDDDAHDEIADVRKLQYYAG